MASAKYSELLKQNKNFRNLWMGQVISELGTWFSFIAELGLIRMMSGSPLATTALLVSRMLPFLLVAPIAGVFADRRSRKQIMIAADVLRAMVALLYLAAGATGSLWAVCLCSALMSSFATFFEASKNASLPNMVTPRELLTANILMLSTRFLQLTLGAALGGLVAVRFGYNIAFLVDSLSFLVSALFVLRIPATAMRMKDAGSDRAEAESEAPLAQREAPVEQRSNQFIKDLREGLAYIWATPFVRWVIMLNIGWATGGGMASILYDQMGGHMFLQSESDRGDTGVAVLYTAAGAGLFLGMLLARRAGAWVAEERRAGLFIGWSLIVHGLFYSIAGVMPTLALVAFWMGASRLVIGMEFGVQETLMMRVLPDEYRGRVFTTDRSLELGTMTLSMIAGGWLLTWSGPRTLIVVSGLLSASSGIVWLVALWLKRFSVPTRAVRESFGD